MTKQEIYNEVIKQVDITESAFDLAINDYNINYEFDIYEFIEWLLI